MKIIVAADENWAIGKDGGLLWHLPEDMKFFRETTTGNVVVMGRKTLDSFPGGKPLKNRVNLVLTKNPDFHREGVLTAGSVKEALERLREYGQKEVFVIGGGDIYRELLPYCDTAYVTRVYRSYEADTFFPDLDASEQWELCEAGEKREHEGLCYAFTCYRRKKA